MFINKKNLKNKRFMMSELDEKKENSLSLRFWQGGILLLIVAIMKGVFSSFEEGFSVLNIVGFASALFLGYTLFAMQSVVNKNARDMRDL